MARASMAALITRLRATIGDEGGSPEWSDDELEDYLDQHRRRARYELLSTEPTYSSGGGSTVSYLDYWHGYGNWEDSVRLDDSDYDELTPDTEDLNAGRWTLATDPDSDVYITGWYYDLHGTAAEVLTAWAAKLSQQFDASTDQQRFQRSQKAQMLRAAAVEEWRLAWPAMADVTRSDTR